MAKMDEVSDDEFLASITSGVPNWTTVYAHCRSTMHQAARRFFRSTSEAHGGISSDDVVQNVMAEVMRAGLPQNIDSPPRLRAYMYTLTWRRSFNERRRLDARNQPVPGPGGPSEVYKDGFEDRVVDQLLASRAKVLIEELPDPEQHVLREHILKTRPQVEVARDMGISDARVRQLLTTGLRRLRTLLDRDAGTGRREDRIL